MLKKVPWATHSYRTGEENEPFQFYLDALSNSTSFDLLLGYFSSASISVLSMGFAKFLNSGGQVRMIINNILSQQDKNAIKKGLQTTETSYLLDLSDFKKLRSALDEYGVHFFECLSWLISNKKIDLKIIRPKLSKGISHYKSGVFSDGIDQVCFKGSTNFTAYGLLDNLEELTTFFSWENGRSSKEINGQNNFFEKLFKGDSNFVDYLTIDDVEIAIKNEFGNKDINELIINENELITKKQLMYIDKKLKESDTVLREDGVEYLAKPRFPFTEGPRPYQTKAYDKWVGNAYKGLFAMATGTGKTITALNCILEEYKKNTTYKFIVLVPTIALANQWEKEISNKFRFEEVTVCSSSNTNWEDSIRNYGRSLKFGNEPNFCILTTYATFRGKRFQRILLDLFKDELKNIILIADEAHTLGSINLLKVLPKEIEKRIGLSATPERQFDDEGEKQICEFFNSFPPEYTFKYNMKEAIENRVLCKYYYYPTMVELTSEELIGYKNITNKLSKFLDHNTGRYKDDPYVNNLLIQRKNIIHKAKNKSACLIDIIEAVGKENFKYAFVYVPEGYEQNYENDDIDFTHNEDDKIIQEYTDLLYNRYKFKLKKFTGETINREEILKQFGDGKLDALLAMKCLDEGVDIPQTQFAIFCSSTGNPRQYIQRRGRVLRFHGRKNFAHIYDMIVKPSIEITNTDVKQIKIERNILMGELKRLVNFAVLAENKDEALNRIEGLCYSFDIDIYDMANKEEEKYNS